MAQHQDRGVSIVAREIDRYLRTHPDAADTLEGIVDWWIEKPRDEQTLKDVRTALDLLVRSRVVRKSVHVGGIAVYRRAKQGIDL